MDDKELPITTAVFLSVSSLFASWFYGWYALGGFTVLNRDGTAAGFAFFALSIAAGCFIFAAAINAYAIYNALGRNRFFQTMAVSLWRILITLAIVYMWAKTIKGV